MISFNWLTTIAVSAKRWARPCSAEPALYRQSRAVVKNKVQGKLCQKWDLLTIKGSAQNFWTYMGRLILQLNNLIWRRQFSYLLSPHTPDKMSNYTSTISRLATICKQQSVPQSRICFIIEQNIVFPSTTLLSRPINLFIDSYRLVPRRQSDPPVRLRSPAHPVLNFLWTRLHLSSAVRHLPTSTSV